MSTPFAPIDTRMLPPTPNSTLKLGANSCVVIGVVRIASSRLFSCAKAGAPAMTAMTKRHNGVEIPSKRSSGAEHRS